MVKPDQTQGTEHAQVDRRIGVVEQHKSLRVGGTKMNQWIEAVIYWTGLTWLVFVGWLFLMVLTGD